MSPRTACSRALLAMVFGLWAGAACTPTNPNPPDDDNRVPYPGDPALRVQPEDLTYVGAFRLPDDYNWGARGIAFRSRAEDPAGVLLVTGFELLMDPAHPNESCWDPGWNCSAHYGEVRIPAPGVAANWEDLPVAETARALTAFDGGRTAAISREYVYASGVQFVPRRGTQSSAKVYGSMSLWYAEGVMGEDSFPTIWMADLDGSDARGLFHVGPDDGVFHGRKMGAYLFTVPEWYAEEYLGGRTLVTGRSRGTPAVGTEPLTTRGGSQGPTLFAFRPWDSDEPSGELEAVAMLYYRVAFPACGGPNVGDPEDCDFPDFTMCDEWTGGAFLDNGVRRAIVLAGLKGSGPNCYDEPPVECHDPCSDAHGYHCQPYERQVIFYDVQALGHTARSEQDPWRIVPYATWRPAEFFLQGEVCWGLGGVTFDPATRRLFIVERGLGEGGLNAAVVHVWTLEEAST